MRTCNGGRCDQVDVDAFGYGYAISVISGILPLFLGWAIRLLISIIGR